MHKDAKHFKFFRFWLGGADPPTPQDVAGGAEPSQDALPQRSYLAFDRGGQTGLPGSKDFFRQILSFRFVHGRPEHLIEAAKRGRLDQMLKFGAVRTSVAFDRGGQMGPPRSNAFFSAPLTIRRTSAERRRTAPSDAVRRPSAATQGKIVQGITFLSA